MSVTFGGFGAFCARSMPLEKLNGPFVFLGCGAGGEGSEISAFAGLGIFLAGIESEFVPWDFANHDRLLR